MPKWWKVSPAAAKVPAFNPTGVGVLNPPVAKVPPVNPAGVGSTRLPKPPVTCSPLNAWDTWWDYRNAVVKVRETKPVRIPQFVPGKDEVEVVDYKDVCVAGFRGTLDHLLGMAHVVRALPHAAVESYGDFAYIEARGGVEAKVEARVKDWVINGINFEDASWFKYAYKCKVPIVGSIFITTSKLENHFIAYVLRPAKEATELVLLEPYNTNRLLENTEKNGELGQWRDAILKKFKGFFAAPEVGSGKIELVAFVETPLRFNLTRQDANGGQCGFWAMRMIQAFLEKKLLDATPDEIRDALNNLPAAAPGGRRRTRRVKRRRRRGRSAQTRSARTRRSHS